MRARILIPALIVAAGLSTAAFGQGAPRVVVGDNPSLSGAPLYVALEKGYYREAGIDVQLEMSGTSSDMAVLLATNRLQVIGGALSAGFFNSLSKGLPIGLLMARATSPYFHYLMIRPDLKAKLREPADLKGRTVAVAARGAILVYELAKILEAGGLSLGDIELKYIPFGQMATALTTGAVDAALMISPLQDQVEAKGIGVKWINADSKIKAQPVLVSVWQMNTDWMRQNEDAARKFVRATLRGVRDYCNAYHRGPNRDAHSDEVFRRQGSRADQPDRMGRNRRARANFRSERQRYSRHVFQGEACRRPGADRQDRACRLGGRGCRRARAVPARP
jgi:NitT/TauT family transport system substrate-binding protein